MDASKIPPAKRVNNCVMIGASGERAGLWSIGSRRWQSRKHTNRRLV